MSGVIGDQLRAALARQQGRLGELSPWQKVLFDEEVLPNYQRFIKDYRPSGREMVIDADWVSLKNYLRFHASQLPKAPDQDASDSTTGHRVWGVVRAQRNCAKCMEAEAPVRERLKEALERRGLQLEWATAAQLGNVSGRALDESAFQLMRQSGSAAAVVVRWEVAAVDDVDSAHLDELRYSMHVTLAVRDLGRHDVGMDVPEDLGFERAFSRLMTDSFADIGARQAQLGVLQGLGNQVFVEITGITDYARYRALVRQFQERLGESEPLVERKATRGSITLAVRTLKTKEEIQAIFSGVPVSDPKWPKWEIK